MCGISKLISCIKNLWRTAKCTFRKVQHHIYYKDVDQDGINEIIIDPNGAKDTTVVYKEGGNLYDTKSDSLSKHDGKQKS